MTPALPDHSALLDIVWVLTVCLLAALFAALHLAAVISQMRKGFRPSHIVMLAGCLLVFAAIPACVLGWPGNLDSLLMAVGGGTVCGSAFWNGRSAAKKAGDEKLFHLSHHLIRFGVVLILVMNFIRV